MKRLKNNSGQAIIEAVLYLTLIVGTFSFVQSQFKDNELMVQLVSGPWNQLSGMIQNGRWGKAEQTMEMHPSNNSRHGSHNPN